MPYFHESLVYKKDGQETLLKSSFIAHTNGETFPESERTIGSEYYLNRAVNNLVEKAIKSAKSEELADLRQYIGSTSDSEIDEFLCPITFALMQDPVVAPDGMTYERGALEHWLAQSHSAGRTPNRALVRGKLSTGGEVNNPLVPNKLLNGMINDHVAAQEAQGETVNRGFDLSGYTPSQLELYFDRVKRRFAVALLSGAVVTLSSLRAAEASLGEEGASFFSIPAVAAGGSVAVVGSGLAASTSAADAVVTSSTVAGGFFSQPAQAAESSTDQQPPQDDDQSQQSKSASSLPSAVV